MCRWAAAGQIRVGRTPPACPARLRRGPRKPLELHERVPLADARVSSHAPKTDLEGPEAFCAANAWRYAVSRDLGSGRNARERGSPGTHSPDLVWPGRPAGGHPHGSPASVRGGSVGEQRGMGVGGRNAAAEAPDRGNAPRRCWTGRRGSPAGYTPVCWRTRTGCAGGFGTRDPEGRSGHRAGPAGPDSRAKREYLLLRAVLTNRGRAGNPRKGATGSGPGRSTGRCSGRGRDSG